MSSSTESSPDQPADPTGLLMALHHRLGASFAPYRGALAAATYGDEVAEYEALRNGCGLIAPTWMASLEMRGEDRGRFLGGLVTCDVKSLEPGQGTYGFLTTIKGRVMADVSVLALDDRLWLQLPPGCAQTIAEHLKKYIIVDRVEVSPLSETVPLTLIGPRACELLALPELPETLRDHRAVTIGGIATRLVRDATGSTSSQTGPTAWSLWIAPDQAEALFEHLLARGADLGVRAVGHRALDRLRIEAGQPLFGLDYGLDNFPQETGLGDLAVSYTKGCYLGQEVVARIHYRGGVNRHLRGLIFDDVAGAAPQAEQTGTSLSIDGREVGTVTSTADSAGGRRIGLAILHQRAEPGSTAELAGGGTARVVELPFAALDP